MRQICIIIPAYMVTYNFFISVTVYMIIPCISFITIGVVYEIAFIKDFPYLSSKQMGYHYKQHMADFALVAMALMICHSQVLLRSLKYCPSGHRNVAALSSSPAGKSARAL